MRRRIGEIDKIPKIRYFMSRSNEGIVSFEEWVFEDLRFMRFKLFLFVCNSRCHPVRLRQASYRNQLCMRKVLCIGGTLEGQDP